jgi:hypothetical protein
VKSFGEMQSAPHTETTSFLKHIDAGRNSIVSKTFANIINNTFLAPMDSFTPLAPSWPPDVHLDNSPSVTEYCVFEKFALLNPHKASDPDNVPAWLLKENADILTLVVTDILNSSYSEARLPNSWKQADITLIPKSTPVYDINKHLKPISLTPILSKLAEEFVVDRNVKPALLAKVDPRQFGTVPG